MIKFYPLWVITIMIFASGLVVLFNYENLSQLELFAWASFIFLILSMVLNNVLLYFLIKEEKLPNLGGKRK
jgi:hypothetical protein